MKIVVSISKALFEKMKSNKNHIDIFYYYDIYPVAEAVSRGKPLTNKDTIKELEKIKSEMKEQSNRNFYENGWWTYVSSVFDKHISELKGENK